MGGWVGGWVVVCVCVGGGGCKTYSWPSTRQRELEAPPLSRLSATCSTGTTGVKMSAELLEQVDAVGSAVGTTRAAVRRSILSPKIMCSELLCRARPDAGLGHPEDGLMEFVSRTR